MRSSRTVAAVALFSSIVIATDFILVPYPNVKLMDTFVFLAAYVYGFRAGASVAIVTETVWSVVSPEGFAGAIAPFLIAGEVLFAVAGSWASKKWKVGSGVLSVNSLFIGSLMLICAFVWDLETNAATALIEYWPALTMGKLFLTELAGIPFAIPHELADFLLGSLAAPAAMLMGARARGRGTP